MTARTAVALHFVERGTGTPALAIHGWTPDHRLMLGCLEPVFVDRPGYRRLYPDLPAMGRTPAPPSITSSDDILDAVQDFVDETIGDEPFLLLGESYGGYLARALVGRRPDQVLGLALICPLADAVESGERNVPEHEILRPDPALMAAADPHLAAEFVGLSVVQTAEIVRRFRDDILPGLDAADRVAMARIQRRWALREHPEAGPPYRRPTLILTGLQDNVVGYVDQFALLRHYPRATYAALDLAGHNLQNEQPGLFAALVTEWLDRVRDES
jgi:pimeloyl-ACP methyl ester carboxylesterase